MYSHDFDIIIATHGMYSKGIAHSIKMIIGEQEKPIHSVSFEQGESIEEFKSKVERKLQELETDKIIILTDIVGGTPTNVCMHFLSDKIHLITGVHLALAIDLFLKRNNNETLESLKLNEITEESKRGIIYLNELVNKKG